VVLLYHRVATLGVDPQRLAVTPQHFAEHLDVITRCGVAMPLAEMLDAARAERMPDGAVAVTFDDGYADNVTAALPALTRSGVPAAMFVTTAPSEHGREFWWDELERLVLEPACDAGWNVDAPHPNPRRQRYLDLCQQLRRSNAETRSSVIAALTRQVGSRRDPRDSHRPLTADEIRILAGSDGITVGSHTATHPSLRHLPPPDQRREIAAGRTALETIIDRPVTAFAYPFGGSQDVSWQTRIAARAAGVSIACTTEPATIDRDTDPWRVPRFIVRDWPGHEFERRLTAWMRQ